MDLFQGPGGVEAFRGVKSETLARRIGVLAGRLVLMAASV
jgi:hypothetical protein